MKVSRSGSKSSATSGGQSQTLSVKALVFRPSPGAVLMEVPPQCDLGFVSE